MEWAFYENRTISSSKKVLFLAWQWHSVAKSEPNSFDSDADAEGASVLGQAERKHCDGSAEH